MGDSLKERKFNKLQKLCRLYLFELKRMAKRYGLLDFVQGLIKSNEKGECKAELKDVELLARIANDDRVSRVEIPKILKLSYRQVNDNDMYDQIDRIDNRSSYSRISTELLACELEYKKEKQNG